jgi:hypothetical protein
VEILPAVTADAPLPDAAAIELRDRARAAILRALGEPDLSAKLNEGQSQVEPFRA